MSLILVLDNLLFGHVELPYVLDLAIHLVQKLAKRKGDHSKTFFLRWVGGLLDFSVRPSPNWTLDFD